MSGHTAVIVAVLASAGFEPTFPKRQRQAAAGATDPVTCRFTRSSLRTGREPLGQIRAIRPCPLWPGQAGPGSWRAGGLG